MPRPREPPSNDWNAANVLHSQVEYGCCGLSEEDAIRLYGEDDIETYLFGFGTLEQSVSEACTVIAP